LFGSPLSVGFAHHLTPQQSTLQFPSYQKLNESEFDFFLVMEKRFAF